MGAYKLTPDQISRIAPFQNQINELTMRRDLYLEGVASMKMGPGTQYMFKDGVLLWGEEKDKAESDG